VTTMTSYDLAGRPVRVTRPDGSYSGYGYDVADQVSSIVDTPVAGSAATTYGYDVLGRRSQMVDASGTLSWTFDSLGRETDHSSGGGRHVGYGYDFGGRVTSVTYPDGSVVARGCDAVGRLSSVTAPGGRTSSFVALRAVPWVMFGRVGVGSGRLGRGGRER